MLSKQHLANPGLRYQQARRDPGEAPPPSVAASNMARMPAAAAAPPTRANSVASRYMQAANPHVAASQDVWVNNVSGGGGGAPPPPAADPDGGVVLKPAFIQNNAHPGFEPPEIYRPPPVVPTPAAAAGRGGRSRSSSHDGDEFYGSTHTSTTAATAPQIGAVRMPGLDGQLDNDNDMNISLPPAVDPYHHVVAQAVDDESAGGMDKDLRDRVANLEEDLKKSYMMLSAHSRHGGLSADGSDADTDLLRQRVQELEQQLANPANQSTHSRSRSLTTGDSDEFANPSPSEGLVTAASSRIVVAVVDPAVTPKPPRVGDVERGNSEDEDEDESKGIPVGIKCLILLVLLGGIGAAVFFLVPFGDDDDEGVGIVPVQVTPTDAPAVPAEPTLSPTDSVVFPICPSHFQGSNNNSSSSSSSYVATGSKNQTYILDCSIAGDVSAIQIDRSTCEPSCAFLLEKSAYEDLCVDSFFALDVPDEYFGDGNTLFELGHLDIGANVSCANATNYIIPDPSASPSLAPSSAASENPTLAVLIPTEPPTPIPTVMPTPPPTGVPTPPPTPQPTPSPTPEPTPPPTEPPVDRLGEALERFFPGESLSETSAEYRALEWASQIDSRNAAINSVEFRERFTLANLFYATNGDSWTRRSGWTGGGNHCDWQGVTCSNEQVSLLDLNDNNMNGPIIKTWDNLALISRLRMMENGLVGTVPTEMGRMSNLGRLELSDNFLDGEFPTQIGDLAQLTNLQIRNNLFRGEIPTHLGRLTRLQSFVAEFNQFSGRIPDELSGMTSLRNIYLGRNQLAGPIPASFESFSQLTLLSISENRLSGSLPAELSRMTNLQRFSAAQNQLSSSIPDDFGAWTAMTYLSVFDNQLTGTIPSSMSQWTNTDTIYFYETGVTGSMNSFCSSGNVGDSNFEFYAECGLECSCCTHCCTNQNCGQV